MLTGRRPLFVERLTTSTVVSVAIRDLQSQCLRLETSRCCKSSTSHIATSVVPGAGLRQGSALTRRRCARSCQGRPASLISFRWHGPVGASFRKPCAPIISFSLWGRKMPANLRISMTSSLPEQSSQDATAHVMSSEPSFSPLTATASLSDIDPTAIPDDRLYYWQMQVSHTDAVRQETIYYAEGAWKPSLGRNWRPQFPNIFTGNVNVLCLIELPSRDQFKGCGSKGARQVLGGNPELHAIRGMLLSANHTSSSRGEVNGFRANAVKYASRVFSGQPQVEARVALRPLAGSRFLVICLSSKTNSSPKCQPVTEGAIDITTGPYCRSVGQASTHRARRGYSVAIRLQGVENRHPYGK